MDIQDLFRDIYTHNMFASSGDNIIKRGAYLAGGKRKKMTKWAGAHHMKKHEIKAGARRRGRHAGTKHRRARGGRSLFKKR